MKTIKIVTILILIISTSKADFIDTARSVTSNAISYTKEGTEKLSVKADIASLDLDLDRAYSVIGKRYVQYSLKNPHKNIGLDELIKKIKPLIKKRKKLQNKIKKIEYKYKKSNELKKEIEKVKNNEGIYFDDDIVD
jgi:hypothetical protein